MAEARLAVAGSSEDFDALREWLQREPELRGHIRLTDAPAPDGAMGSVPELRGPEVGEPHVP
jgi:hypothetical protein